VNVQRPRAAGGWVLATRPRTLFATVAPVVLGSAWAFGNGHGDWVIGLLTLFSAVCLQIAANLANDYWDYQKGADTGARVGPQRVTASGLLPPGHVLVATFIVLGVACAVGVLLVARGGWPIFVIGALSAVFALLYTAGPAPLAYLGLGDLFALVFYGPVAVAGTAYLQSLEFSQGAIFLGLVPGAYAVALIATNNLRDRETDKQAQKQTLAVRFGTGFARWEIVAAMWTPLIVIAWLIAEAVVGSVTGVTAAAFCVIMAARVGGAVLAKPAPVLLNALFPQIGLASIGQAVFLTLGILL
jgi:1,4-dihydroxy-2-naphthoate polyprenyltransferase